MKDKVLHVIKGTDWILLFLALTVSAFGTLMVHSATLHNNTSGGLSREALVMIIATALGLAAALIISFFDYDILCKLWFIWAALGVGLMLLVMSPLGVAPPNRPDSQIWIKLGFFYFQPSELVKVLFVITFSTHLSMIKEEINKPLNILLVGIHALIPTLLVMKSGDDGSAAVFICIALAMIFMAGISWKYILAAGVLVAAAIPLLWFKFFSDYQKQRFIVIVDPEAYPDVAYQQNRGITAICNGGFTGEGLFKGTYTQSGAVPVSESDMIFTVVCEELGFIGGLAAFVLLLLIILRVVVNGRKTGETSTTFMGYGIAAMIGAQTIINIAMCLRVGPVIGITLPFFSAGGSSTLCLYVGLGLAFSAYRTAYNQKPKNFRLTGVSTPFRV